MLEQIVLTPTVHTTIGILVLISTTIAVIIGILASVQKRSLNRYENIWLILTQVVLMVQILVGIKLLDQGMGVLQKYVHYLGGLGALGFWVALYWLPMNRNTVRWSRSVLAAGVMSAMFAYMSFFIGRMVVHAG